MLNCRHKIIVYVQCIEFLGSCMYRNTRYTTFSCIVFRTLQYTYVLYTVQDIVLSSTSNNNNLFGNDSLWKIGSQHKHVVINMAPIRSRTRNYFSRVRCSVGLSISGRDTYYISSMSFHYNKCHSITIIQNQDILVSFLNQHNSLQIVRK